MAELENICRFLFCLGLFVFVTSQDPGTDPCAGNNCAEGSTCYPASAGMGGGEPYICACPFGKTGMYCYEDDYGAFDPCAGSPCGYEATCFPNTAMNGGYECSCPPWQTGDHCEQSNPNYDPCSSNPCLNEGSCMPTATGWYTCSCLPGYYGDDCGEDSLKVEVEGCEVHRLVEGMSKSFQDWCFSSSAAGPTHEPFIVRLFGMKPTENYNFQMVMMYRDQETVIAEQEVQGANAINGDDITTLVEGLIIPAPDPTTEDGTTAGRILCNNDDAFLYMRVTQVSDTSRFYETDSHRVTVQCDFGDTDLTVTSSGTLGSITSTNDGSSSLGDLLSDSSITFNVGKVAGTSDPPLLGHDASYYVVAFLTKRPVMLPGACTEDDVPEIAYPDIILWYKKFKTLDELSGVSDEIKAIKMRAENRCGENNVVIFVDPIYTIPGMRCNNYIVIPIILEGAGCDTTIPEEPRCAVIVNPFESGRDTALTYHHHQNLDIGGANMPDDRLFKFTDFATWRQEMSDDTDHIRQLGYKANKFGNGRLKLLEHDIRTRIDQGELSCVQTEEEARQSVKDMEELDPPEDGNLPTNIQMILSDYNTVLTKVQQLKDQPTSADALKTEVKGIVESMPAPENVATFDKIEKVMHWTKKGAYNALANITNAILDDSLESMEMKSRYTLCKVGDLMMRMKYMKKYTTLMEQWLSDMAQTGTSPGTAGSGQPDTMMYLDFALQDLVQNITRQLVMLNQFFPGASFKTCLDKIFQRIVGLATGDLDDDSWLFDNCRKRASNCLKKVKDFCSNQDDNCAFTTPLKEDKDLCLMRHFTGMVDRENKVLGIHDIRDWLREINKAEEENQQDQGYDGSGNSPENNDHNYNGGMPDFGKEMYEEEKGKGCSGEDPVSPKKGPLNLFKWDDNQTLLRGVPKEDIVCWNKVGVCTCQDCTTAAGTAAGKRKKK